MSNRIPAGLTTTDTAKLHVGTQIFIYFLMLLGAMPLVSIVPVVIRRILLTRWVKAHTVRLSHAKQLADEINLEVRILYVVTCVTCSFPSAMHLTNLAARTSKAAITRSLLRPCAHRDCWPSPVSS